MYGALLELGRATSGEILKQADLRSGKIYEILESLRKRGFVTVVNEGGVNRYRPADPRRIYDYIEEQKEKLKEQENAVSAILPELMKKVSSHKEKISIEIFTGEKGVQQAYERQFAFYRKERALHIFGSTRDFSDLVFNSIRDKREKAKVVVRRLINGDLVKEYERNSLIRFLPYLSPIAIEVIDKLALIHVPADEPLIIVIESSSVAQQFTAQFEGLWKIAKK